MTDFTQNLILVLIPLVLGSIAVPSYLAWKTRNEKVKDDLKAKLEKELADDRIYAEKKLEESRMINTELLNRQQEEREIRRQYFKSLLDRVNSENKNVKKCRRLLRSARTGDDKSQIKLAEYIRNMENLEDSQLEFESLGLEMDIPGFEPPPELKVKFTELEGYLTKVLARFENGNYPEQNSSIPLNSDPGTSEFITHYHRDDRKKAPFFMEYVHSLKEVQSILIRQISI